MLEKIVVLHGWGSNGNDSSTVQHIKKYFEERDVEVITPTYDYTNPDATAKLLSDAVKGEDSLLIVGISLGGFWARWLANNTPLSSLVLLNPALDAHKTTAKYLGETTDHKTGKVVTYTRAQCNQLKKYYIEEDMVGLSITAIVATDDDVIDPNTVEYEIGSDRCRLVYTTGGHRLTDYNHYLPHISYSFYSLTL